MKRHVVASPASLTELLRVLGESPVAIDEGRVFVDRRRVKRDEPLRTGACVEVAPPRRVPDAEVVVLFADHDYVSVDKPTGVPTVPDLDGARHSLVVRVAEQLGVEVASLVVTSRLDRPVTGVVTFARTAAAAQRITAAREAGTLSRRYVALASGPATAWAEGYTGDWDAPIGRTSRPTLRAAFGLDAKPSRSRFAVVARAPAALLLALWPATGRTHQLRVHASHAGAPLLGDRDYGGATRLTLDGGRVVAAPRVALHCASVTLPTTGGPTVVAAPVPADLRDLWARLAGAPEAWDRAMSWEPGIPLP